MPNYNYRPNDYMRRNQCQRPLSPTPIRSEREYACNDEDHTPNLCMQDLIHGMPIAMAYVPWQEWKRLYAAEKALCQGTIFEELDKPFFGKGGCC